jgi:hypothetical protein
VALLLSLIIRNSPATPIVLENCLADILVVPTKCMAIEMAKEFRDLV